MIGNVIRTTRLKKGISQKELAQKSNLHQCQISKIESGSRKISLHEVCVLAQALGVDVKNLIEDSA